MDSDFAFNIQLFYHSWMLIVITNINFLNYIVIVTVEKFHVSTKGLKIKNHIFQFN